MIEKFKINSIEQSKIKNKIEYIENRLDSENVVDFAIKSLIDKTVITDKLPKDGKRGKWESGSPGNGTFTLNDDYIFTCKNISMSGKLIEDTYGSKSVEYKGNDPDFSPYAFNDDVLFTVPVSKMPLDRNEAKKIAENYCAEHSKKSVEEIREYMKKNNLSWHETPDRKHIMPIPTIINAVFTHTGGISKQQSFENIAAVLEEHLTDNFSNGFKVTKDILTNPDVTHRTTEINKAIGSTKNEYNNKKQLLQERKKHMRNRKIRESDELKQEVSLDTNVGSDIKELGEKFVRDKKVIEDEIAKIERAPIAAKDKVRMLNELKANIEKIKDQYEEEVDKKNEELVEKFNDDIQIAEIQANELQRTIESIESIDMEAANFESQKAVDAAHEKKMEFEEIRKESIRALSEKMKSMEQQRRSMQRKNFSN